MCWSVASEIAWGRLLGVSVLKQGIGVARGHARGVAIEQSMSYIPQICMSDKCSGNAHSVVQLLGPAHTPAPDTGKASPG